MTDYAVGDIQGCHDALLRLNERLSFDPGKDRLWFTGDLVNRGPGSLETLRYARDLGDAAVCVLGNHDLHLLAVDAGLARSKKRDTLDAILDAPDRKELMHWLRHRPVAHHQSGVLMVHAGLPPQWDLDTTLSCAAELQETLRGDGYRDFLRAMYGNRPIRWDPELSGYDRLRFIVNALTRMRYCTADGDLDLDAKGPPGSQPTGLHPWFRVPGRASESLEIVFGHWSTLGAIDENGVHALDSGCVWGGKLGAIALDGSGRRYDVACEAHQPVKGAC